MPTSPNLTLFAKYYIAKAAKEKILIGKPWYHEDGFWVRSEMLAPISYYVNVERKKERKEERKK